MFTSEGTDRVGVQAETGVPEGIILILGPAPALALIHDLVPAPALVHDLAPVPTLVHQGDHIVLLSILLPDIMDLFVVLKTDSRAEITGEEAEQDTDDI